MYYIIRYESQLNRRWETCMDDVINETPKKFLTIGEARKYVRLSCYAHARIIKQKGKK